jgi:CopG family nickel-responsive transcriptional regulator
MNKSEIVLNLDAAAAFVEVISVSLPPDLIAEMDRLIQFNGFKGRSELVRTALRQLSQDSQDPGDHIHGSITISYPEGKEARISEVRHAFHDVVLSLMHTHCKEDVCMDVLIVGGQSGRVLALTETLRRMRDVTKCHLVQVASQADAKL